VVDRHLDSGCNTTLTRYVKNPLAFRGLLRDTRSVISGSTVLHYALQGTRRRWSATDLDVYSPLTTGASVVDYLVEMEGFVIVENLSTSRDRTKEIFREYGNGAIASVTTLRTPSSRKVDVITCTRNSALLPLTYFWGTIVTNYMSADAICITYPRLTFDHIGILNPTRVPLAHVKVCIDKYERRGFFLREFQHIGNGVRHTTHNQSPLHCPQTFRNFSDAGCLRIQFSTVPSTDPVALFPVYNPTWKFGGAHCAGKCRAA
ncbi:hypothetical protein BV25DRAFT_1782484, partial [Artomyces pyxidatus]